MEEFKFELTIVPEDYDYSEEEIVYRIYFAKQLISERSLPILKTKQGIRDKFYLKIEQTDKKFQTLYFLNFKSKKCTLKKISINDISFTGKCSNILSNGLFLNIKIQ
jgi:hypothetical protein